MAWWSWIVFGVALLVGEILTPGTFFIIFFGFAALLTGAVVGLLTEVPPWMDWILFSCASIVGLLFFRGRLVNMLGASPTRDDTDSLVGQQGTAAEEIVFRGEGRVELRGSPWRGRNVGASTIAKGSTFIVRRVDGLVLDVEAAQ